jgi:two-component system LytT family response regulator|nr:LytTR family DNA-binding domain-containing protein [uncultured Flavobacterium sp.]
MIQCLIIEDEKASQDALIYKLKLHFPEISIQAVIDNAPNAISYLSEHKIDLVFVDNHIKQGRGMDVINHFKDRSFKVVFSTAFSGYAIEALNNNASYYLLKPYSDSEFITAVNKCIISPKETSKSIIIGSNKEIVLFKSILYLQSEGAYTIFHLEGGKTIYTSKNIGFYEKELPSKYFFRIHHSTIVNQSKIETIIKGKNTTVSLKNGTQLPISTRKLKNFITQIKL